MFVFVVWHKTEIIKPKRNRAPHREPRTIRVQQSKKQQDTLSKLGAAKWDSESRDYTIYRVKVPHAPSAVLIQDIGQACLACGLSGPYWGDGKIAWQGVGAGADKRVNAKIARQIAEEYLRDKLDILDQVRVLAGYSCKFEAWNLPDVPENMRDSWTYAMTPEIDRWMEYLSYCALHKNRSSIIVMGKLLRDIPDWDKLNRILSHTEQVDGETMQTAYNRASALLSTKSQNEAFVGELCQNNGIELSKPDSVRVSGRKMLQSELESLKICRVESLHDKDGSPK